MRMHLCPFQSTMDKNRLEPFTWFGLTDETITSFLPPNRCWYDEESPSSQGLVLAACFKGGFTQHGRVKCFTNKDSTQPVSKSAFKKSWRGGNHNGWPRCPAPPAPCPRTPHRNGCQNKKKKKKGGGKLQQKGAHFQAARAWGEWLCHSDCTMQHSQDAEIRVEPVSSEGEQRVTYGLALT